MASTRSASAPDASEALQNALEAGDVALVALQLRAWPPTQRLAHERTPLMLAATHRNTQTALELVELALQHGARLHAKDADKRHVLMLACYYGADVAVVRRILEVNKQRGDWQLAWWHRDRDGLDAVALASKGGHGKLAAQLLDHELDLVNSPLENYPLKVLETALVAGDERCALEVMESSVIQRALAQKAQEKHMTRNPWQENCTLFSCVAAAVKNGLPRALEKMKALNSSDVSKAVWYSLYSQDASHSMALDQVQAAGQQYWQERVWATVRPMVLLRHRGMQLQASSSSSGQTTDPSLVTSALSWISWASPWSLITGSGSFSPESKALAIQLATLPDSCFDLLLQFLAPSSTDEAASIRFWLDARRCSRCGRLCIPNECRTVD